MGNKISPNDTIVVANLTNEKAVERSRYKFKTCLRLSFGSSGLGKEATQQGLTEFFLAIPDPGEQFPLVREIFFNRYCNIGQATAIVEILKELRFSEWNNFLRGKTPLRACFSKKVVTKIEELFPNVEFLQPQRFVVPKSSPHNNTTVSLGKQTGTADTVFSLSEDEINPLVQQISQKNTETSTSSVPTRTDYMRILMQDMPQENIETEASESSEISFTSAQEKNIVLGKRNKNGGNPYSSVFSSSMQSFESQNFWSSPPVADMEADLDLNDSDGTGYVGFNEEEVIQEISARPNQTSPGLPVKKVCVTTDVFCGSLEKCEASKLAPPFFSKPSKHAASSTIDIIDLTRDGSPDSVEVNSGFRK